MRAVLLDTGVIVALLDRSERDHERCRAALRELSGPLVTCEAVIAEACYLLRRVAGAPEAVLENVDKKVFQIPFRLEESAAGVRLLMKRYARVPMDLADACLVALAEATGTGRILTLDGDFGVYRWRRTRPFEILPD
ncbi:MAG TPA: PIN domain-containing protein [Polyangia bacterium]|nr:PIN domain-containing protein [Polyangia bacterium]